jgi:hypothetical protein
LKGSMFFLKKRMNLQAAGRDSMKRKKERKEITISYSAKFDVWPYNPSWHASVHVSMDGANDGGALKCT